MADPHRRICSLRRDAGAECDLALEARLVLSGAGEPIAVTASSGIAGFPEAVSAQGLLAAADGALYAAKRGGKNRVAAAREPAGRP